MLGTSNPSQVFLGVHFVLFGFDRVNESKVRFKLVNGGGVDLGQYGPSCTHVIVDKLSYDDPVCVAARNDGKTLVTALWVDHSADIGMAIDVASVMYRPPKDLKGIPGAEKLIVCLTGYQCQDRDDIMTMVGLMGAQFSKPLVANRVTHLICYKFEGEKYELAKRLRTIKLVNHRWLEDCLKDWVLLPEDKYKKSGYELEVMAEEAKDSEEEAEDLMPAQSSERNISKSPFGAKFSTSTAHIISKPAREAPSPIPDSTAPEGLLKVDKGHDTSKHDASCLKSGSYTKTAKPMNTDIPKAVDVQDLGISGNANSSGHVPELQAETSDFGNLVNDLRLTPENAEGLACSDAKVGAVSYSRKNQERFSPPRNFNERLGSVSGPSQLPPDDLKVGTNNDLKTPSRKMEKPYDKTSFSGVEGSGKGNDSIKKKDSTNLSPQKRTIEISTKSKSKMIADAKLSTERIPSANDIMQGLKLTSLMNEATVTEDQFAAGKDGIQSPETVRSKSREYDHVYQNSVQRSDKSLSKSKTNGKPNIEGLGMGEAAQDDKEPKRQNAKDNLECSYPSKKKSQNEKSTGLTMDLCNKVSNTLIGKSPRKKTVAKKSLGSRPKLVSTAKQKGSVSMNESAHQDNIASCFSGCLDDEKLHTSSNIDVETSLERENVSKSAENLIVRDIMDDETEAPDDKCEYEEMPLEENNAELIHFSKRADTLTEEKLEAIPHITKCEEAVPLKKGTNGTEQEALELVDSTSKLKDKKKGRKLPPGRTKKTAVAKDVKGSEAVCGVKINKKRKNEAVMETLEKVSLPVGKNDSSAVPTNSSEILLEMEKENRPIGGKDIQEGTSVGNSIIKASACLAKSNKKAKKIALKSSISEDNKRVKREAACFIVSGHRLQRKEFQQIIRRLKGRVCRDSHQWSYQATHFIAPDPLRRTEKFFAAAASGRWILKTDFLTACNEAGKFLAEEPYEWHRSGLSEDGAINMEAPRKWRLLRERTGHGALYGMRIIIYGDCIAPSLDTLKRVVKAGDGCILATSPPYTRFLDTGIDYAIVTPGMPRVDLWVQEFLKHEIPCVLADYLVEYVCKPGFSLEKHVLYGTHAWAERSFAKLQSRAEEIIDNPPKNLYNDDDDDDDGDDDDDTACHVCGSRDRGDVMLICGDESGSVGCGVGAHIDCCDPPLTEVPQEDWFCPKCSDTRSFSNSSKRRKNGVLASSERK